MSIIAILGTALAIMMIMTIIVSEEIRNASVAPEANRWRTYYVNGHMEQDTAKKNSSSYMGSVSYEYTNNHLKDLKTPELVSIFGYNGTKNVSVNMTGKTETYGLAVRDTDANYWKLYSFSFLKGRAFTQEEFQSGVPLAIICETEARNLFKGEEPIGKSFEMDKKEYRIIGVVKDVSTLFKQATSKIWIPYTSTKEYEESSYQVALLLEHTSSYPALFEEIRNEEKRYAANKPDRLLFLYGPYNHQTFTANIGGSNQEEVQEKLQVLWRKRVLILAILLLVPALNLSGISFSRIKKRTSEIGVRKAFGAKKYVILLQVLYENFITSLIGGVLGLIFSYIAIFQMKKWLLSVAENTVIPIETLITPGVFIAVFLVCLVVNLLSAGLPAYKASRVTIVKSLNQNDK
ncbi:ABC transporter permease [Bacteroides sp. 214]|uniref:ABC transporter permease n=1 Tax=Bacteroides sp. 214 TaxID=2302935 RepID=UPI001EF25DA4|nr:ABC transporter permease [Bacteroides sp. 214]